MLLRTYVASGKSNEATCSGHVTRCVSGTGRPSDAAAAANVALSSTVTICVASPWNTSQYGAKTSFATASYQLAFGLQTGT
jgi:hypothetical protein